MKTQLIDIKTADGISDTFIAYPDDGGSYPAVLFFMDGFGLRDYLYEMAKTVAARGYYVFAPNFFYRVRRSPVIDVKFPVTAETMGEARQQLMKVFSLYKPTLAMQDIATFMDFLPKQKQVKSGPIGVTGYCMGGNLALRTAAAYPGLVKAAASFHGGNLATDAEDSPHAQIKNAKAEIYVAHADNDQSAPPEQIARLDEALKKSGLRYETELYKDAIHGFTMLDLPAGNKTYLDRHWQKLFPLLERNLR